MDSKQTSESDPSDTDITPPESPLYDEYLDLNNHEQLLLASRNGDFTKVKSLVVGSHTIDLNCKGSSKSNRGWTPLHLASYFGHNSVVNFLIKNGADLNIVNDSGDTPLHKAAYTSRADVVYLLLTKYADVNTINSEGYSPKHMTKNEEIRNLIEAAEQNESRQTEKQFLSAARSGDTDKLKDLLKRNSLLSINVVDEHGNTALHCVAYRGQHMCAVFLIQNGIETNIKNNKGQLATDIAKDEKMKQLLELKPIKQLQKSAQRYEGVLLKKTKVLGLRPVYCVLERGVLSYFPTRADASSGAKRKGVKYLDNTDIELSNNGCSFRISFNDGRSHTLSVDNQQDAHLERQKWINSLQEHIAYSNHYINQGLNFEDDDDFEDLLPLGSMQDVLKTAQAHQANVEKQIAKVTTIVNSLSDERTNSIKTGSQQLSGTLGTQLAGIVGASRDMTSALNHCLTLFTQQEELRKLQLQQEMDKSRVLQEALQVLATEHHELEQTISGHRSPQRCYSSEDDEFFDCDEDQDDDDQLFDELLRSKLSSSISVPKPVEALSNTTDSRITTKKKPGWSGRTTLPVPAFSRNDFSVWSILKQCIGKELSKVTMPVIFNEPLSFLQRLAEYMEYSKLLDKAVNCGDPVQRIQYIAAFAVSASASNWDRLGKPFNPLLGETYQLDREELGFRIVCEQVSHHPPISAFHVESKEYRFYGAIHPKIKFWGKSVEIQPKGTVTVELLRHNEVYTWHNVNCNIHNIIVGKLWVEHTGLMEIVNHKTNHRVALTFKPMGWFNKQDLHRLEGYIYDSNKEKVKALYGSWVDSFYSVDVDVYESQFKKFSKSKESTAPFSLPFNNSNTTNSQSQCTEDTVNSMSNLDLETDDIPKRASTCDLQMAGQVLLWQSDEKPLNNKQYFSFTLFAMMLNELDEAGKDKLPPTDSRLRPDIRKLEEGEIDSAADEKVRLEEKQRAARKDRKKQKSEWIPRWFRNTLHPQTGKEAWLYTGQYFNNEWSKCPDVF